jgi:hypothetical protein
MGRQQRVSKAMFAISIEIPARRAVGFHWSLDQDNGLPTR